MTSEHVVLAINPGSSTTKLALYHQLEQRSVQTFDHSVQELSRFGRISEQLEYRLSFVNEFLTSNNKHRYVIEAVMGRGGLLHPLKGGVYRISDDMKQDLMEAKYGEHACNLGALMADSISRQYNCPAYIADPVVVDEMINEARISGIPEIERKSIFHALNHKCAARTVAEMMGKPYEQLRMIVAHLGSGISIASHRYGYVIDVNNALDGEGPFTPERSGGVPVGDFMRLVLSGRYSEQQLKKRITGEGGLFAYWNSRDVRYLEEKISQGDPTAEFYLRAMVYQVSKEIASHGAVLEGRIDAIVLTGGMANYDEMVKMIEKRISFLAPVYVIGGEREMYSLAETAYAILEGK